MEDKEYVVWTLTRSEIEADPRDFKADMVLTVPTDNELKNLPKAFSLGSLIWQTYYQNGRWSCTALGTVHSMLVQNIQELLKRMDNTSKDIIAWMIQNWENPISLSREDLWKKMGHKLEDKKDSGDYAENAMNTSIKQGILGTDEKWNPKTYFWLNFAYKKEDTKWDSMLKYYLTKYPLIMVIKWTQKTWQEMTAGEIQTVIEWYKTTGGHCVCCVWYDEHWIRFVNSRSKNTASKTKSAFCISWENHKKMVDLWMINWRFRVLFDKVEAVVDLELLKEEWDATVILEKLNKFYKKCRYPKVKDQIAILWNLLRSNYPEANKAVPK